MRSLKRSILICCDKSSNLDEIIINIFKLKDALVPKPVKNKRDRLKDSTL